MKTVWIQIFIMKKGLKIPEEKIPSKRLSIIMLDFVLYVYEKYHPQTFLEECKYKQQKQQQQQKNYIDEELKSEIDTDTDTDNEE